MTEVYVKYDRRYVEEKLAIVLIFAILQGSPASIGAYRFSAVVSKRSSLSLSHFLLSH
jgi:hypothetical protein